MKESEHPVYDDYGRQIGTVRRIRSRTSAQGMPSFRVRLSVASARLRSSRPTCTHATGHKSLQLSSVRDALDHDADRHADQKQDDDDARRQQNAPSWRVAGDDQDQHERRDQ